jgi:branched-subunit amino acid aminotransferase/4-amino-4-deoxychorismate lyase
MPQGIFVDEDGYVLEGPNSNFAIMTNEDVFVTPPFDRILSGITVQRLMEILQVGCMYVCFLYVPVACSFNALAIILVK